jgi:hypothetical protein
MASGERCPIRQLNLTAAPVAHARSSSTLPPLPPAVKRGGSVGCGEVMPGPGRVVWRKPRGRAMAAESGEAGRNGLGVESPGRRAGVVRRAPERRARATCARRPRTTDLQGIHGEWPHLIGRAVSRSIPAVGQFRQWSTHEAAFHVAWNAIDGRTDRERLNSTAEMRPPKNGV